MFVCIFSTQHISAQYCPPFSCRKWQNSPHASRSPWVQILKDLMRSNVPIEDMAKHACLDAETENGETSDSSGVSSDPIPDDFMGVKDAPEFFGSSSEDSVS